MVKTITTLPRIQPELDTGFVPAVLWNNQYKNEVEKCKANEELIIALERSDGTVSVFDTKIFPHTDEYKNINCRYVERILKFLLWMKGGYKVYICGNKEIYEFIKKVYSPEGERSFDYDIMGVKIYDKEFIVEYRDINEAPAVNEIAVKLGGNLDGCRIGFDLGGSDRKCAAVIDGKLVFSEEIRWDPYFQKDPSYHKEGIMDSLKRAAEKLPRVDAIGGSAAGVYVNNRVRIASLFRGVPEDLFKKHVVNMFLDIQKDWNNVPLEVANDGDVTALAGAMEMNDTGVLGISMGTSEAAGYLNPDGNITGWLNELAFAPIDYRENAPVDEWSGDKGCGVQYFSQQAVARIAPAAGFNFPDDMPFPERLVEVQNAMKNNDERAAKIYRTIGVYFGYTVAHYASFYEIKNLLILGRVTSGEGGEIILSTAQDVLKQEFPELAERIKFRTPDEKSKRHGQAFAAATLPEIKK